MNEIHGPEGFPDPAEAGIDLKAALAMAGGDVALLRDLAGAFFDEVPRLVQRLRTAIEQRDAETLQDAAHQVQGVMRCLHANRPLQQAHELELLAQDAVDWPTAEKLLAELNATVDSAFQVLKTFLREQS